MEAEQTTPPRVRSVDVVIVNYNARDRLDACLAAAQADGPGRLVVVDNASSDGSAEMVRQRFPGVVLHANTRNLGYGAAANQGIASCSAEYVLLLNSDAVLTPGALQSLATYLEGHPRAAVAGPRLVGSDGLLQVSWFPLWLPWLLLVRSALMPWVGREWFWTDALGAESASGRRFALAPALRRRFVPRRWDAPARAVPWVLGAAMLLRRAAFEAAGRFDEAFFMYFEEVDLCLRLAALGWEVHFAPVTTVIHAGGTSTRQRRTEMAGQYLASTLLFYGRHYPGLRLGLLKLVVGAIAMRSWLADFCRSQRARDSARRAQLEANLAVWQRLLRGAWNAVPTPLGCDRKF